MQGFTNGLAEMLFSKLRKHHLLISNFLAQTLSLQNATPFKS